MIANSAVTLSTWPAAPSYPNEKNMVYVLCVLSTGAGKLTFFQIALFDNQFVNKI